MPAHVIAFDLDMTLVDSRDAIAGALDLLSVETGVEIDSAGIVATLGQPIRGRRPRQQRAVAARLAGAVAVGVTTGAASAEELWAAGADMVVASLEDAESKLWTAATGRR